MRRYYSYLYPVIIFILVVSLYSCEENELEYSCDPLINDFVKENKLELAEICVSEFITYELPLQKAIFNSWDFHKKREIWLEKLGYLKNNQPLNNYEIYHIQILIDHITEDYFLDESILTNSSARSQFTEYWFDVARNDLGWSDKFIAFIVFRLYTDPSQLDEELSALKSLKATAVTDSEMNCDCSVSQDFCGYSICNSGNCKAQTSGCGWLWTMPCNGLCY